MKKLSLAMLLSLLSAVTVFSVEAQAVYLGHVSLLDRHDVDVINLQPCRGPGGNQFVREIMLTVRDYPAEINSVVLTYFNGERDELEIKEHFQAGSSSRWIDLNGRERCIKRIVVKGDTDTFVNNNRKQSDIFFYGR